MTSPGWKIRAVTFDFFQTLAYHRDGGRGRALVAYLTSLGIEPKAWEHQVLYDVFEPHAREYSPDLSPAERNAYLLLLARRVFERLDVRTDVHDPADHATKIWELIGPSSLAVYPDVPATLASLRSAGYRLAVISNWQCGLGHFCVEVGIGKWFDHVVASAEIGHDKPDAAIFAEAARRLAVEPGEILHVGDSVTDDLEGALAAGFHAVLLDRDGVGPVGDHVSIRSLARVPALQLLMEHTS